MFLSLPYLVIWFEGQSRKIQDRHGFSIVLQFLYGPGFLLFQQSPSDGFNLLTVPVRQVYQQAGPRKWLVCHQHSLRLVYMDLTASTGDTLSSPIFYSCTRVSETLLTPSIVEQHSHNCSHTYLYPERRKIVGEAGFKPPE